MDERISKRIVKDIGRPDLVEILAQNLSGSDFHSLLLAVLKLRIGRLEAFGLAKESPVTRACDLDGRLLSRVEGKILAALPQFEAVELSPLCPLGAVNLLTGLDQANVLSTVRAFECVSDPTISMALECARRRKNVAERRAVHKLCTNQRVVRFPQPQNPAFTSHFKLFSLVSAARDGGSFTFECQALREHIESYITIINVLNQGDFSFGDIVVEISDTRAISQLCANASVNRDEIRASVRARDRASSAKILAKYSISWPENPKSPASDLAQHGLSQHLISQLSLLQEKILSPLQNTYPQISFAFNMHRLTGLGYYQGPCFHIKAKNDQGELFMLADGGFVDWSQVLLSDSKERMMTSAIGTELVCRMFARAKNN